jgi:hypothetical protein
VASRPEEFAQDLHRSPIGPNNTSVDSLVDIGDGCVLKEITEAFLALSQPMVGATRRVLHTQSFDLARTHSANISITTRPRGPSGIGLSSTIAT